MLLFGLFDLKLQVRQACDHHFSVLTLFWHQTYILLHKISYVVFLLYLIGNVSWLLKLFVLWTFQIAHKTQSEIFFIINFIFISANVFQFSFGSCVLNNPFIFVWIFKCLGLKSLAVSLCYSAITISPPTLLLFQL